MLKMFTTELLEPVAVRCPSGIWRAEGGNQTRKLKSEALAIPTGMSKPKLTSKATCFGENDQRSPWLHQVSIKQEMRAPQPAGLTSL